MICSAAAQLFRERGFQGTSIDDIGAAVGMTGPALYRHFPSKEALLAELLERALERARQDGEAAVAAGGGPRAVLERLVAASVVQVELEGELVIVAAREIQSLGSDAKARIVRRQRAVVTVWVETLRKLRPELAEPEALAAVIAVAALLNAASRVRGLRPEAKAEQFRRMALAALLSRG